MAHLLLIRSPSPTRHKVAEEGSALRQIVTEKAVACPDEGIKKTRSRGSACTFKFEFKFGNNPKVTYFFC